MRLYAVMENVGSEYYVWAPTKLSLSPIKGRCYFAELDLSKVYECTEYEGCDDLNFWKLYNGKENVECLVNIEEGLFINQAIFDRYEEDGIEYITFCNNTSEEISMESFPKYKVLSVTKVYEKGEIIECYCKHNKKKINLISA